MTDTSDTGTSSPDEVNTDVGKGNPYLQLGVMATAGFAITATTSDCWSCGNPTDRRKPGAATDIWRCIACGVEWEAPHQP